MNVKLSVVIPSFNEEEKIEKCIKSYLNQTTPPYEIIIVDGGSKDKTRDIVRKYQKKNKMIKLFNETGKRSPANARNMGWKKAKGNYILFMDADSQVPKDFIKTIISHISGDSEKSLTVYASIINSWREVYQKYFWYGRTMHKYLIKNFSDYRTWTRFLLSASVIILPFLFFFKVAVYLWLLTLFVIFFIGSKRAISCYKKSRIKLFLFVIPLYVFLIMLIMGIGILSVPFLYLSGKYTIGR